MTREEDEWEAALSKKYRDRVSAGKELCGYNPYPCCCCLPFIVCLVIIRVVIVHIQAKERRSGDNPDYKGKEDALSISDITTYKSVAPNIVDP